MVGGADLGIFDRYILREAIMELSVEQFLYYFIRFSILNSL